MAQVDDTRKLWMAMPTASSALEVARGGTGQATEAEAIGEMTQALTEDTTPDTLADYLPTYDASADTGKKVLIANLGGWREMTSGTFSAAATVDFVLTTYQSAGFIHFKLYLWNIDCSADADILMRTSTNAGSSYESGASDYETIGFGMGWSAGVVFFDGDGDQTTTAMQLAFVGGAAGEHVNVETTVWNTTGANQTFVHTNYIGHDASTATLDFVNAGKRNTAQDTDAFRILPDTGTFTGNYLLLGMKAS